MRSKVRPRYLQLPLVFERAREAAFETWLADNPRVWALFVRFVHEVMRAGHAHYSADAICHRLRWHEDVDVHDAGGFKVNNNHVAFLARRYERQYPQHAGFFRMREQRAV